MDVVLFKKVNGIWVYCENEVLEHARKYAKDYSCFSEMCKKHGLNLSSRPLQKLKEKYKEEIDSLDWNYLPTDPRFKAIYQDYDWMYSKFIDEGMNIKEIADECGATKRVIQKWLYEKHNIKNNDRRYGYVFNDYESSILIGSLLGDGHIDKREGKPVFIVSHAENQKDYLYWKYDVFKKYCNKEPSLRIVKDLYRNGKTYKCRDAYRISTRIIDDLKRFKALSTSDTLNMLDELALSVWVLDDGYRNRSNWSLCVARFTDEEKALAISILNERFGLDTHVHKSDNRYVFFRADSSRDLDDIIIRNIPNNLDIVKYKILENEKISSPPNYRMVDGEIGLATFCKKHKLKYSAACSLFDSGITSSDELFEKLEKKSEVE